MKYLFTCSYSAGVSGVWTRVQTDAKKLIEQGHEVYVFSSNREAGSKNKVADYEEINGIKCYRFPVRSFGSDNAYIYYSDWLIDKFREIKPDEVFCNTYRHHEGHIILNECENQNIPCNLITHAPFNRTRGIISSILVFLYDKLFGKYDLKRFNKIYAICKWEFPYLKKLGVPAKKIIYSPNEVSNIYKKITIDKYPRFTILFLGRITPVKNLEILARAYEALPNKKKEKVDVLLIGPIEDKYRNVLWNISERLIFGVPTFNEFEKLKEYNKAHVFILPSKQEGYPTALLEAKACEMKIIASDIPANKEILEGYDKGYLFNSENIESLKEILEKVIK